MTKEECQRANWSSIGYSDAFKGRLINKFFQREEECAKFEVKASPEDYQKGFELGKIELCKPPSALDLGLKGVPNIISQCPQEFISSAKEAYEKGLKVYNANSELDKILKRDKEMEAKMKILGKRPIKLPSEIEELRKLNNDLIELRKLEVTRRSFLYGLMIEYGVNPNYFGKKI